MKQWKLIITSGILAALMVAGFLINFIVSQTALRQSQQDWCPIIHLSIAGVHPSKLSGQKLANYRIIITLGHKYGCL